MTLVLKSASQDSTGLPLLLGSHVLHHSNCLTNDHSFFSSCSSVAFAGRLTPAKNGPELIDNVKQDNEIEIQGVAFHFAAGADFNCRLDYLACMEAPGQRKE